MKMNYARVIRSLSLKFKDRPAIVNLERGRRYSYWAYHLLGNRIANMLRTTLSVDEGDRFLLILENDNLSLMMLPCVIKQKGTVVLTNLRDSFDEHKKQIERVSPKVVFIEAALLERYYPMLRGFGCAIVVMDKPDTVQEGVLSFWDAVEGASDADTDVEIDPENHVFMLRFTGGTTGAGKCAAYSINNLSASRDGVLINPDLRFTSETRFLHVAPLSHGTMMLFLPTYFVGGVNLTMNRLDLEGWHAFAESEQVTHSFLVPTVLYRLLEHQRKAPRNLTSLNTIIYGAAPMSPTRLGDLLGCFGPIFAQIYAATEAAMPISVLAKSDHEVDPLGGSKHLSSAGRACAGIEISIADEHGVPLPDGETGEVRIRCPAIIKGYYQDAVATAAEFVDGTWRSGDIGYIDTDGYLYIVDRLKDMIITGGFNVYAVEVETALMSHAAVHMAAVVGIPDTEWGEAVHAEIVLKPGCTVSHDELIISAKTILGPYKAPKSVVVVHDLPLSSVGKILRREVKRKYWPEVGRKVS